MQEFYESSESMSLEHLKLQRSSVKGRLTRIHNYLQSLDNENVDPYELKARLQELDKVFNKFDLLQTQIETRDEGAAIHDEERRHFENKYFSSKAMIGAILGESEQTLNVEPRLSSIMSNQDSLYRKPKVKLPQLELPKFDGDIRQWPAFKAIFMASVDQTDLPVISKLQYLKSALTGEAAGLISSLLIIEENYCTALDILHKRAKQQEREAQKRIQYLIEFNEKNRKERAARAREKEARIKQRVQAAAEMELRRKITMIRQWRQNEKKRLQRLKEEKERKKRQLEEEAERKWIKRIEAQNQKIQEEALLLKLYSEDQGAGAMRRTKKAEIYAYNTDLELQRIKLANWKKMHGGERKAKKLVKKMGTEFEKSKRGAKGMSPEFAQALAKEAMAHAVSTQGDALMTLGQARAMMDVQTILPTAPLHILNQILESAIMVFTRRRVHLLLRDVEKAVRSKAAQVFFQHQGRHSMQRRKSKQPPRYSIQLTAALAQQYVQVRGQSIAFGEVTSIDNEDTVDNDLKSVKDRPPTPVPSMTKLAEVTFADKVEDLPDPVTMAAYLPERKRLLEMVNTAAKLLARTVSYKVQKGMDITVGKVTLPHTRQMLEWGEAVESLAEAVVENRISHESADVRRCGTFLTTRILTSLQTQMKQEKAKQRAAAGQRPSVTGPSMIAPPAGMPIEGMFNDFYVPEKIKKDAS